MLPTLRRSRLLAAFLLLASPALGGTVLPAVHPCPVDAPWLAGNEAAGQGTPGAHEHHAEGHHAPSTSHHTQVCDCVGGCVAGMAATPPAPGVDQFQPTAFVPVELPAAPDASLDLSPSARLLPPATAPPSV